MAHLSDNQIESTTTIVTKQRDALLKFAESDGRARDAATILSTALVVLGSAFYAPEGDEPMSDGQGVETHNDAHAEDSAF